MVVPIHHKAKKDNYKDEVHEKEEKFPSYAADRFFRFNQRFSLENESKKFKNSSHCFIPPKQVNHIKNSDL